MSSVVSFLKRVKRDTIREQARMKWLSRPFIGLLLAFFLMGNADPYKERRAENDRIQAVIRQTIQDNKQPDPEGLLASQGS